MARLPGMQYLMQQIGGEVILFEDGSEREVVRYDVADQDATARVQLTIYQSELSDEDKCYAHFWSGYFWANAPDDDGFEMTEAEVPVVRRALEMLEAIFSSEDDAVVSRLRDWIDQRVKPKSERDFRFPVQIKRCRSAGRRAVSGSVLMDLGECPVCRRMVPVDPEGFVTEHEVRNG